MMHHAVYSVKEVTEKNRGNSRNGGAQRTRAIFLVFTASSVRAPGTGRGITVRSFAFWQ